MFSLVRALSSPTSAEGCPSLFGWFTGTAAQSDFSGTCMSAVRLVGLPDARRTAGQRRSAMAPNHQGAPPRAGTVGDAHQPWPRTANRQEQVRAARAEQDQQQD